MTRQMIEIPSPVGGYVDGWRCTDCAWCFSIGLLRNREAIEQDIKESAREIFNQHVCGDYPE